MLLAQVEVIEHASQIYNHNPL